MRHTFQEMILSGDDNKLRTMQYEVNVVTPGYTSGIDRFVLGCLLRLINTYQLSKIKGKNFPTIRASYKICMIRVFHSMLSSKMVAPVCLNIP
jgi:hypothetical protein